MEETNKKGFFELLSPKSALLVGAVGGILTLGTIGFIVLAVGSFSSKTAANVAGDKVAAPNNPAANNPAIPAVNVPSITKSGKPVVELFVMSYCPFGLQMEKALLPAWNLLKNKANISVKFVYYAMHEKKEMDENTRQYCIQKEQGDKFIPYLDCFALSGDYQGCLGKVGVNESKLNNCVAVADKKFKITEKYNDKSTWLSGRFPLYPIDQELNTKYNVGGSPTLVINGKEIDGAQRSPEAIKQYICAAFENQPAECGQTLNSDAAAPGFGGGTAGAGAAAAGCGN